MIDFVVSISFMNDMNWSDISMFLHVARAGGLNGAAQTASLSAPSLGRRMAALEADLGKRLFERRQTGYRLTSDGAALLELAEGMENTAMRILRWRDQASAQRQVRVSAGSWMTRYLLENFGDLWRASDPFSLSFVTSDKRLNISRREADIGIRNARPQEAGLAGQRLGTVDFAVYGVEGPWIIPSVSTPSANWSRDQGGDSVEVSEPRHVLDLLRAGGGKGVLPTFVGDPLALKRVGARIDALTHRQYLVFHDDDRFDPAIREVINRLRGLLERLPQAQ